VKLHPVDVAVVAVYLALVALLGLWLKKRATRGLDSYYLAGRSVPWWMLGLSGCSSYIDIGGTMGMVGLLYYVGLKGLWSTHLVWGWFIICFYMAFQAKWIRRSGVMTFAEWNEVRFGAGRDTEYARLAAAVFLLVLMVFNLAFMSVGVGKFGEEVLGIARWQASIVIFSVVGVYVTLGGFFGVIYTDILQTILIFVGAAIFAVMAVSSGAAAEVLQARPDGWGRLAPTWELWSGFKEATPESYRHYAAFGPLLLAGSFWCLFRVLAGPNVWDFQFFLSARSPRDAALASGVWTVGYTARWVLAAALLALGVSMLDPAAVASSEKIMPQVLGQLQAGLKGFILAVLLAALMSTLDAMINVTSSVVVNDFLKRYFVRGLAEHTLVRLGQAASVAALLAGFCLSIAFKDIVSVWETMIFAVVTVVLVPSTFRWHWWRFGPRGFAAAMAASAAFLVLRILVVRGQPLQVTLAGDVLGCLIITLIAAFATKPADMEALVRFYARVRPFGVWGPVRRAAVARGLVPAGDRMPAFDVLNGLLAAAFQFSLAAIPFCGLLGLKSQALAWSGAAAALAAILYATWYRTLPARDEETAEGR